MSAVGTAKRDRTACPRRWLCGLRWLSALLVATLVFMVAAPVSVAQDRAAAVRELKKGSDYRVRVTAALTLGKLRDPSAAGALEDALGDPHPAVRAAAAAALGKLGVPKSAVALERALQSEKHPSVKKQIQTVLARLSPATTATPKFIVQLGDLRNRSGVDRNSINQAFASSTRQQISNVPGALVFSSGADAIRASKSNKLPVIAVDGSLTRLSRQTSGSDLSYSAKVEYVIRQVPQQSLKGSMSGAAQALADARSMQGPKDHDRLQTDAVAAAVQSAMQQAPTALAAASK